MSIVKVILILVDWLPLLANLYQKFQLAYIEKRMEMRDDKFIQAIKESIEKKDTTKLRDELGSRT